jgi:energy-coupling factor transporter ATP-binding protein EcfA2
MSFSIISTGLNDDADRLPSLGALRIAHNQLLKQYREQGNTSEMLHAIARLISQGKLTGAVLDSEETRWAGQGLLDYWSSILYRAGYEPPDATLDKFDPAFAPELPDVLCPYVGLTAFQEEHQHFFYGREALLEQLIEKLQANRLLTVVGTSGSGKSSVVLGGLIPKLKANALSESESWQYYPLIIPGRNPLESLARSLCPSHTDPNQWIPEFAECLRQSPDYLTQFIATSSPARPTVLVVDQFEEIFTLCRDEASQQAFMDHLLSLTQSSGLRHTVILIVLPDFELQIAPAKKFREVFDESKIRITNLRVHELREAIEKPAELVGLRFEEGIVNA